MPRTRMLTSAANRMAVPVAENRSNLMTAAKGVGSATMGGVFWTTLSRKGTCRLAGCDGETLRRW